MDITSVCRATVQSTASPHGLSEGLHQATYRAVYGIAHEIVMTTPYLFVSNSLTPRQTPSSNARWAARYLDRAGSSLPLPSKPICTPWVARLSPFQQGVKRLKARLAQDSTSSPRPLSAAHRTGYSPRLSRLIAGLAGTYGHGCGTGQSAYASLLGVPMSLGATQKVVIRVTLAIDAPLL